MALRSAKKYSTNKTAYLYQCALIETMTLTIPPQTKRSCWLDFVRLTKSEIDYLRQNAS